MPIVRRLFALLPGVALVAVAAGAFTSCGGDGGDAKLLAAGEYDFSVSGSLELAFPAATTSALPIAGQTQDTEISGDVTLNMNADGSFEFEGFGIEATVREDGGSADLNLSDSPSEDSTGKTGKTGKDGTQVDIYWQADLKNREERSATNEDTIGGSSPDPLGTGTKDLEIELDNRPVPFADAAGKTIFSVNGGTIILTREAGPQAQPTTPAPQTTATATATPTPTPVSTPAPGAQQVRTEQEIKCQHTEPDVKSDLFDLILIYLKKAFPATPQSGSYQGPDGRPRVVMAIANEPAPPALPAPALGGDEEPLAGATVTVTVNGPGVLDNKVSGVTDASGQVTLRAGINKFGAYNMTIDTVVGADGTVYGFDQNSVLSLTYEVGPVCELTPTPSP